MPLPFILGGLAVGAGLFGAKKAYDAHEANGRAKSINRDAERSINEAKADLEQRRIGCQKSLEHLGLTKLDVLNHGILPFVKSFKKIKNVELRGSAGLDELSKFNISKEELAAMEQMGSLAESVVSGAAGGVAAGALAAIGAYGAATTFGVVAGTGTAISTLSGIAATNATLAFLGGGSLAAGGFGMAAGAAVLGGLVAGPFLAIMGLVLSSKAEENLEKARANRAEAEKIVEQCRTASSMCVSITMRCDYVSGVLDRMKQRLVTAINTIEKIVYRYDDGSGFADFGKFNDNEKKTLAAACALAKSIKSILDTPILTESGELTPESAEISDKTEE